MELKHFRVRTTPNGEDKFLKIDLKQNFDVLDVLSLKINKTDFYKQYTSDYGVLVGRVNVNGGFGVPNAKVSIFIPLTDEDSQIDKISQIYPYLNVNDVNDNGTRYNLFIPKDDYPLGTFPSKQEVLDSDLVSDVYKKYYKYTTVTNESGDYMIFGIPTGTHTLHLDIDLSDIGARSFSPSDIISTGFPESNFNTDGKGFYSFRAKNDLSVLPQIVTQDMSVDIKPLWGGSDEEVGITRYDFNTNLQVYNYATLAFSLAIDPQRDYKDKGWFSKDYDDLGLYNDSSNGMSDNRHFPGRIDQIRAVAMSSENGTVFGSPEFKVYRQDSKGELYPITDYNVVMPSKWDENGMMIIKLPCYDDRYVTDEFGNNIISTDETGLGTTGQYLIDVMCDHLGKLDKGGEYYNFRLTETPYTFVSNNIYTVAWEMTKNHGGYYGFRTSSPWINFVVSTITNQNVVSYVPRVGDWVNGLLYFGRMGNSNEKNETSIPYQLKREINGVKYYKVSTAYINVTQMINPLTEIDANATVGIVNGGIWVNKNTNLTNFRKIIDRGSTSPLKNGFLLYTSYNSETGNNFKRYRREIG